MIRQFDYRNARNVEGPFEIEVDTVEMGHTYLGSDGTSIGITKCPELGCVTSCSLV